MFSVTRYERFAEEYGLDPGFKKHGYFFLAASDESAAGLEKDVALQNRLGLDSRFVDRDEINEIIPALTISDLKGAAFCGSDGYLDPHTLVQGYVNAFKARGGLLKTECRVDEFLRASHSIEGVMTNGGPLRARAVVVAAGPHTGDLLRRAGVDLPLKTCRRQIFSTDSVDGVDPDWPLTHNDHDNPFYFRPETGGVIMSLAEVEEMDPPERGNEIPLSRKGLPGLAERATARCPILGEARIRSGWAGLRTITPDELPVLGSVYGKDGLFLAAGFSGCGITLAPFAAEVVAAAVAGEDPCCGKTEAFDSTRFLLKNRNPPGRRSVQ